MQSFEYDLEVRVKYAHDGTEQEASYILLKAPTANNSRYTAKLKQGFFRAIRDFENTGTEAAQPSSKDSISGDEILGAIMMSKSVDFGQYTEDFKAFMCKGVALLDGKEPFKEKLFEQLTEDDLMSIMGGYLENFLIASWMKKIT